MVVSTKMKFLDSFQMSCSNWCISFSQFSYLSLRPMVSNLTLWVRVQYSLCTTSHFFLRAAMSSFLSSSFMRNFYLSISFCSSIYISLTSLYSSSISPLIFCKYYGTLPKFFFFKQSLFLFSGSLGAANMFSTALATMKFLSLTSPIIGLSSFFGIAGFFSAALSNLVAIQIIY